MPEHTQHSGGQDIEDLRELNVDKGYAYVFEFEKPILPATYSHDHDEGAIAREQHLFISALFVV